MADANLTVPTPGGDTNAWGTIINGAIEGAEAAINTKVDKETTATGGLSRDTGSGNIWEVLSGSTVLHGVQRSDGGPVVNGQPVRVGLHWYVGDADPTNGGALTIPSWVHYTLHLGATDTVPTWALSYNDFTIDQVVSGGGGGSGLTYDFRWKGTGLANGSTVTTGTAGTDDTPVTGMFNATNPTVTTTTGNATISRAITYSPAGAAIAPYFGVTAGTTRRVSWLQQTPATFPSAMAIMSVKLGTGTGSDVARVEIGTSGAVRVKNSANVTVAGTNVLATSTWYRFEFALTQSATPANGVARVWVYDMAGTLVHDSGDQSDATGYLSSHDRIYFGTLSAVTSTFLQAEYAAVTSASTTMGRLP